MADYRKSFVGIAERVHAQARRTYRRKKGWTMRYLRWLQEQKFDHPAHQIALQGIAEAVRIARGAG